MDKKSMDTEVLPKNEKGEQLPEIVKRKNRKDALLNIIGLGKMTREFWERKARELEQDSEGDALDIRSVAEEIVAQVGTETEGSLTELKDQLVALGASAGEMEVFTDLATAQVNVVSSTGDDLEKLYTEPPESETNEVVGVLKRSKEKKLDPDEMKIVLDFFAGDEKMILEDLDKEGVWPDHIQTLIQTFFEQGSLSEDTKTRLFYRYVDVAPPAEALQALENFQIEGIPNEVIKKIQNRAIITNPHSVVERRYFEALDQMRVVFFNGKYEPTFEQKVLLVEALGGGKMFEELVAGDEQLKEMFEKPPFKHVTFEYSLYSDFLGSDEIPFDTKEFLKQGIEAPRHPVFALDYDPREIDKNVGTWLSDVVNTVEKFPLVVEKQSTIEQTLDKWCKGRLEFLRTTRQTNDESMFRVGLSSSEKSEVSEITLERLGSILSEMQKDLSGDFKSLSPAIEFYISYIKEIFLWIENNDLTDEEKNDMKGEIVRPILQFFCDKETSEFNKKYDEKIENPLAMFLEKKFPSLSPQDLRKRRDLFTAEVFTSVGQGWAKTKFNSGEYEPKQRSLRIKRKNFQSRTAVHETVHGLSQGESAGAKFFIRNSEKSKLAVGLTEAVVDRITLDATGERTYVEEIKMLNELRHWTFSSPFLNQRERPKAMKEKDLPLEFFVVALFGKEKSLEHSLEEEGFDEEDVRSFVTTAEELFSFSQASQFSV